MTETLDLAALRSKVRILLSQSSGLTKYKIDGPPPAALHADLQAPGAYRGHNEPLTLLRALHVSCAEAVRPKVLDFVVTEANPDSAGTAAHFLLEMGAFDELQRLLVKPGCTQDALGAINQKLTYESHLFDETSLSMVDGHLSSLRVQQQPATTGAARGLTSEIYLRLGRSRRLMEQLRYVRLRNTLLDAPNPAVNLDLERVLARTREMGLAIRLPEAFHEVDVKLMAALGAFDFKGCMGILRAALERLFEDTASRLSQQTGVPLPEGDSVEHLAPWKDYILKADLLSRDEAELAQSLYTYLSNADSHELGSQQEQVRVARSFVIELALLVTGRAEQEHSTAVKS